MINLEIAKIKERDKCEDCGWFNKRQMCDFCRLDEGGNAYSMPNLFIRKSVQEDTP